ncbi:MAG TPA: pilus assembly protein PilM [Rhodocyclaceae bacterium]
MQIDLSVFNPKARPLIGLDISSFAVKMVELADAGNGSYRIEHYAIEPLPKDAVVDGNIANLEATSDAIEKCWARMSTSTRYVALALPTAAVITKKIILPANLSEQEMEVQVETEANQYIPFALEEVNLDFQVIGPAASGGEEVDVLIAASRKEKVEDRVAAAEAASMKPLVMDVESYAAQAAFELVEKQLPGAGKDQIIAVVDVGSNVMNVTMMKNDQPVYQREQAFGGSQLTQEIMRAYGMSFEEAETAKRKQNLPENYEAEILRPFLENLALEASRALQFFFTSTPFNKVDQIILTGGCAILPGIVDVVGDRTQVPTLVANPFAAMAPSAKIKAKQLAVDAPSLMVACGLALRRFDP